MAAEGEHRDALLNGKVRGRGANLNPGNRFEDVRLHVLGEHLDEVAAEYPEGRQVRTTIVEDGTRSVVNRVDSPDLPFSWTLNPYRGCEHGCIYCYARPTHEYLGMSCGLDFETKIVAKRDAPELFRKFITRESWAREPIVLSGVTDPYQPMERELGITRACLEIARGEGQPMSLITKNHMITRDVDILAELASHGACHAAVSITTLDPKLAQVMEPRASSPRARLEAVRELTRAGVPTFVMTAPIIPGLNDHEIPALLEASAEAGAKGAGFVLLRLPYQIKALFLEWLQRHFPDRAAKVESFIRESRDGELYRSEFFTRHRGTGERAASIERTFALFQKRYGLNGRWTPLKPGPRRLREGEQMGLFGGGSGGGIRD